MKPGVKNMIELPCGSVSPSSYWALLYASPTYYPTLSPEVILGIVWTTYAIRQIKHCWAKV